MLVMEMSTIILSVLRADFFTPQMQIMSQACFALSFFLFRIVLSPYIYYQIISTMYNTRRRSDWCFPDYLFWVSLIFGGFFNCLNFFCKFKSVLLQLHSIPLTQSPHFYFVASFPFLNKGLQNWLKRSNEN
jgi:hypothetical protein